MSGTVKVVIVDDEALIRAGLATILSAHPKIEVVGQAPDGKAGIELVRRVAPDVVLMDVQMPVMDGLAATKTIVADPTCRTAVVVLTTFHRADYLMEALRGGASGFLLKTDSPEHLSAAVLAAAAGDGLLSPEVTREVIARATASQRPAAAEPTYPPLTEREVEVMGLVSHGMNNDEIAQHLVIGRNTVKTHVSNLLTKLNLRDRVQIVIYAYDHGYAG